MPRGGAMRRAGLVLLILLCSACAHAQTTQPASRPAPYTSDALAELPSWPVGIKLPDELGARGPDKKTGLVKGDVLVWIPTDGPSKGRHFSAMLLVPENTDSKHFAEHPAFRAVATKHEIAVVYLRGFDPKIEFEERPDGSRIPVLLNILAEQTGLPEFRHAPWITFGKSSRGKFPFRMAWLFPDRTIASLTYHGETPTWPVPDWAKLNGQSIISVNCNGETEWGGTWFNHVRPSLLNYRGTQHWLSHVAVAKDVGHGDYVDAHGSPGWGKPFPGKVTCVRVWDYLAVVVDKAMTLRVPTDRYPTDAPLALKQVDESTGYLIDPYAVEEMFAVPHLPLKQGDDGKYVVGGNEEFPVDGFASLSPPADFTVPANVPVVPVVSPAPAKSPDNWLLTDSLKFAMQADPMTDLGELRTLRATPGLSVQIDGKPLTFQPIQPQQVGPSGGIALNKGLRPPNAKITLLAYTVVDVPEKRVVRVNAGYTAATRVQLVLGGVPIRNKQVLELAPGKYPLLVVLRMTANWDRIEPGFEDAQPRHIELARQMQADADAFAAQQAKTGGAPSRPVIRKASDVPPDQRAGYFWVADREQAQAWFNLHNVKNRPFAAD
jgi:hypothetical protein